MTKIIEVNARLTPQEAQAFGSFLRLAGRADYAVNAKTEEEATLMQAAGDKLRRALAHGVIDAQKIAGEAQ
ncbi:hypothetical protein [Craterilacuibacter sp. RT1T]|uniref:DUF7706 family protein n=1 Tax=Craterilacuibacter sp. RT1T TaxID=2942211 RepID=UPI0020BE026A|nr:hypothetical protein [Craterilacuibacter sp. RT1T]MCL6262142.1 hypothetical protein [Craterilacuibacter sp. RT1T]